MKLVSFGPPRAERPGVFVLDRGIAPLDTLLCGLGLAALDTNTLLSMLNWLQPVIEDALTGPHIPWVDPFSTRLGPPVPTPGKLLVAGATYRSHVDALTGIKDGPLPSQPILLIKPGDCVIGPYDPIIRPPQTQKLDYETEIGVVIGRGGRNIDAARAEQHVAGYLIANDLTAHDLAVTDVHLSPVFLQMTRAKSFPSAAPLGPWLVTKDEVPDPQNLRLRCWVNGQLRQDGSSAEMMIDIPHLIEDFSHALELRPGDVILTGTTTGSGAYRNPPTFLQPGDVVCLEIDELGRMESRVTDAPADAYGPYPFPERTQP